MPPSRTDRFYWRAFVTFSIVFSFLVIAASGLVLYIAPPGRVANWSQWRFGLLQKADWQAVHTVFALLFLVAAAVHLYFNWRVIVAYVRTRLGQGIRRKWELAGACGLGFAVLALTLAGVPPFATVVSLGESAKASWSNPATEPPVPHAEAWTLAKFAETTKVPVERAMQNLETAGMAAKSPDMTIDAVAATYGVTPKDVYVKALGQAKAARAPLAEGGGYGMKTVQQVAEQLELPLETALQRLRGAGLAGAMADSNIRALANENGRKPFEIVQVIEGTAR
jgi:hypothetical protein